MGSLNHVNNNSRLSSLCQVHNPDFSRADEPFIFLPKPALAGGT